ncbi:MAG: hypothetical protein ACKOSQ_04470, partial [Planctomycetaceae bacterium]
PDLTAGGEKDKSHDWLLGPTGLRGWMFYHEGRTTHAATATIPADVFRIMVCIPLAPGRCSRTGVARAADPQERTAGGCAAPIRVVRPPRRGVVGGTCHTGA